MKYYIQFMIPLLVLGFFTTNAQQRITGRVVSLVTGKPLPGANIRIKNLGIVTVSNQEGLFVVSTLQPAVTTGTLFKLEVSLTGFAKKDTLISFSLNEFLQIKLPEQINTLQEVSVTVSTGYQNIPKDRSTGSFTFISNNTLNQQVSTDILSRLESVTSGLIFDRGTSATPRITIRGLSTMQPNMMEPLIILDNFPYEGELANINPNDVEDITILKDAAAASIWGAKAANGVIVISTKKGKLNQALTLNFTANATVINKPDLFYKQAMTSSDFIDVEQMLFAKDYYKSQISAANKPALSPVVELLIKKGTATAPEALLIDEQINALRNIDVRNDFNKYVYQSGLNQQYALNVNSGTATSSWLISVGLDRNQNNLDDSYNRLNLRFQHFLNPVKNLTISSGIYYTQSITHSGKQGYGEVIAKGSALYPYARLADADGNPLPIVKDWRYAFIETTGAGKLLDWKYYPLTDYQQLDNSTAVNDLTTNLGMNYKLLKWLSVDVKYQYERQGSAGKNFQGAESYAARNLVNSYSQISTSGETTYKIPPGAIISYADNLMQSHNLRGQLNLDKTWARHSVTVIAGSELRNTNPIGHTGKVYGFDENTLTSATIDYTVQYPSYISGAKSFISDGIGVSERLTRFISLYANTAYTYNDRYTISLSARRDASNLFGFKTNDRWNPLWSAGTSWDLYKEKFYKSSALNEWMPYLKLRMTYGFSGNIHPSMAAATTIQYYGTSAYTLLPYARFDNYANPELRWETTAMFNTGLEFKSKNNRINGSIEYYHKKSKDLFAAIPVDYTGGVGATITKNTASMKGSGFDLNLLSINLNSGFRWDTEFNISTNRDEVTNFYLASQRASTNFSAIPTRTGLVGKPVYSMLSYKWAGLDPQTGAPRGYFNGAVSNTYTDLTGAQTTVDDLNYHGSAIPTVSGSIGNTFSYRGFSTSIRILYKLGHYFRKSTISYNGLYTNWIGHGDYARRWQQTGDDEFTDIPAMTYPASTQAEAFYIYTEPFVLPADHIRLQYVNIAYQLQKTAMPKLPFKSLQVSFNMSNLGLLWRKNKEGFDPDYAFNSGSLKPSQTFSLGLKAGL